MFPNLQPFYDRIEQMVKKTFKDQWNIQNIIDNAVLIDKDKKIAETKIFQYIENNFGNNERIIVKQQMVFNEYFNPSPFTFEYKNGLEGMILTCKDETTYFIAKGILTEAFLQGKNKIFGLRESLLTLADAYLNLANKINVGSQIGTAVIETRAITVTSTIDLTETISNLENLKNNLESE